MSSKQLCSRPHPHPASPSKGEGRRGAFGEMAPQSQIGSSPCQGEGGWGFCPVQSEQCS